MRFSAPRSISPSPVRGRPRNTSTFGLQSDSDSEDYTSELESSFDVYSDDDDDGISKAGMSSSSSSSFELVANVNKLSIRNLHKTRTPLEQRVIDETVTAIRLRVQYTDPYEEWEKETRKDAFQTARKEFAESQADLQRTIQAKEPQVIKKFAERFAKFDADSRKAVERSTTARLASEEKLQANLKARTDALWKGVEAAIKLEEERLAARLEAERKAKAEEERKQKELELKKLLEAEKLLREETERKKAEEEKRRAEEERKLREIEEQEKQKKMEEEKKKRDEQEVGLREKLKMSSQSDDWRVARSDLYQLKSGPVRSVKSNKELKSEWGKLRRQIVPKVGQLTNDPESISRISQQITHIISPGNRSNPGPLYFALLSSLAKAIILQAETEVVAEKRSAIPLAQLSFNLLERLEHFPSIFYAKIVQRCGGWSIPIVVPMLDVDGLPWNSPEDRVKASGVRRSLSGEGLETTEEYSNRISAIMRVYFHILKITPRTPLHHMFQLPRVWTWFARMTGNYRLLQDPVAPQLIYTCLDVLGHLSLEVWGQQWVKMLALVYEGITEGYEKGKLIGGNTTEGAAARTRTMITLEDIVNGVQS